ncbi:MAG: hypothetical protein D6770_07855 [Anaerolineae bacterium]|nr:MAG: hypothetical protein D6770_07855 [Anaerolineae bacterium]
MAPIVHGLEAKYYTRITFVYLDIDDPRNEEFKRQFGFRSQPEFYLLDGQGNIVKKWVGRVSVEDFEAAFIEILDE